MIAVVCGGVGAARFLRALRQQVPSRDVVAIVNVADDLVLHGLTICPDLDTITYTLAGLNNEVLGWGLTDETWRVRDELAKLGGEAWFSLGDRDLATHLYRSQRLVDGATKADVAGELARHHGIEETIMPITNDTVATVFDTALGPMSFQEYFVKHHHGVVVNRISFAGASKARVYQPALDALAQAERIIIAPSNPLISIDPMLAIPGVRHALEQRRSDVVAISPIIGGEAVKGPAARLMHEQGLDVSALGVAAYYQSLIGTFVLDAVDADLAPQVAQLGVTPLVANTMMGDPRVDALLAEVVVS